MTGTRFTTIVTRFLMGVSGGFLVHAVFDSYQPYGKIANISLVVFGLIFLLYVRGETPKTKQDKSQGNSKAVFIQLQTILIVFAILVGGWLRWAG